MTRLTKFLVVAALAVLAVAVVLCPFSLRFADRDVDLVLAAIALALLGLVAASETWSRRVWLDVVIGGGIGAAAMTLALVIASAGAL